MLDVLKALFAASFRARARGASNGGTEAPSDGMGKSDDAESVAGDALLADAAAAAAATDAVCLREVELNVLETPKGTSLLRL